MDIFLRKRRSIYLIILFAIFTGVILLASFLSLKSNLTSRQTLNSKAAEPTLPPSVNTSTKVFSIPDNQRGFNVLAPALIDSKTQIKCTLGESPENKEWGLWDLGNDNSICNDVGADPNNPNDYEDNKSRFCPGADYAKETPTARFCYWGKEKKFNLGINTNNMKYNGCYVSPDGAYSTYVMWSPRARSDYTSTYHFQLELLQELRIQAQYSTDFYSQSSCPVQPSPALPPAEESQGRQYGGAPHAFSYFSFSADNLPKNKVIFYQPLLWDNRPEMLKPENAYANCNFGDNNWFVISEPISVINGEVAAPGRGLVSYNVNILDRLKHWVNYCMQKVDDKDKQYDLRGWRIAGLNFGNEEGNTPIMTNTLIDPKIVATLQSDTVIGRISTTEPQKINGRRITSLTATASRETVGSAQYALDKNMNTSWHTGAYAPQSLVINLGTLRNLSGLQILINQAPMGYTTWNISAGRTPQSMELIKTVSGITKGREWLSLDLPTTNQYQYIKVDVSESPSHISLFEVNVFEPETTVSPRILFSPTPIPKPSSSSPALSSCPPTHKREACLNSYQCKILKGVLINKSCQNGFNYCCLP